MIVVKFLRRGPVAAWWLSSKFKVEEVTVFVLVIWLKPFDEVHGRCWKYEQAPGR